MSDKLLMANYSSTKMTCSDLSINCVVLWKLKKYKQNFSKNALRTKVGFSVNALKVILSDNKYWALEAALYRGHWDIGINAGGVL